MAIRDEMRKCVVFLGYKKADGKMHTGGSAFWVVRAVEGIAFAYLVTARHCIEGITKYGLREIYLRANLRSGCTEWISTDASDWKFHPEESTDVAVLQRELPARLDHAGWDASWFYDAGGPPKFLREEKIGLGDVVFVMGLFTQRIGNTKNIPIIRMGSISAMPDEAEPIRTEKGPMVAYLVESHSIAGLSGSPVFIDCQTPAKSAYYLLGLMHGHFGCDDLSADCAKSEKDDQLNTGITAVVPCHRIKEAIEYHFAESENKSLARADG